MKKTICTMILCGILNLGFGFNGNEKEVFHEIMYTASSVEIVNWNITDTSHISFVQETIDNLGRTRELRFYNYLHHLEWAGSGFFGGPIIRYDYEENRIIETFFSNDYEIANDFMTSEVPCRFIYHLNEMNQIIDSEIKYKIEFDWTRESLDKTIEHLEFYRDYIIEGEPFDEVFGYNFAIGKLSGINPTSKIK